MVAFATSSSSTKVTVARQTGEVTMVESDDAMALLNQLTAEGFDYMLSHGRVLQALCECHLVSNDDGTVTLKVDGTICWATGHTGFTVSYAYTGACVEDLLKTLKGFYEEWNTRYVNKVDLCDLRGNKVDLAGMLGRTRVLNDSDSRQSMRF